MDALSFAMGGRSSTLRVKQLRDLIHGAHIGRPVSDSASVAIRYRDDIDQEVVFRRRIFGLLLIQIFLYKSRILVNYIVLIQPYFTRFTHNIRGKTSHCVLGNSTEYFINNEQFTLAKYLEQLERIGIVSKAQNCLIFQVNIILN